MPVPLPVLVVPVLSVNLVLGWSTDTAPVDAKSRWWADGEQMAGKWLAEGTNSTYLPPVVLLEHAGAAGIGCCEAGSSLVASFVASLLASVASIVGSVASLVAKAGASSHSM